MMLVLVELVGGASHGVNGGVVGPAAHTPTPALLRSRGWCKDATSSPVAATMPVVNKSDGETKDVGVFGGR